MLTDLINNQIVELINGFNRKGHIIDLNKRNHSFTLPLFINYSERVNYPLYINQKKQKQTYTGLLIIIITFNVPFFKKLIFKNV